MKHKFEVDSNMLSRLKDAFNDAKSKAKDIAGINNIPQVKFAEGGHSVTMPIFYAGLLIEHIEDKMSQGRVVDIAMYDIPDDINETI